MRLVRVSLFVNSRVGFSRTLLYNVCWSEWFYFLSAPSLVEMARTCADSLGYNLCVDERLLVDVFQSLNVLGI